MDLLRKNLGKLDFAVARRTIVTSGAERGKGYLRRTIPPKTEVDPFSFHAAYVWKQVRGILDPSISLPDSDADILVFAPAGKRQELDDLISAIVDNIRQESELLMLD